MTVAQMNFVLVILDSTPPLGDRSTAVKIRAVEMVSRVGGMKLRASWQPKDELLIDRRRCRRWSRQPNESQKYLKNHDCGEKREMSCS